MPRLLIPKRVSYTIKSKSGYDRAGTKAFIEYGTKIPARMTKIQRQDFLKSLAENSEFFIKRVNANQLLIGKVLKKAGIHTEKYVQDLHDGTYLIQAEGIALGSAKGAELLRKVGVSKILELEGIVAKMFSLGISHGHIHMGNIVITPRGEFKIIDLGKTRMQAIPKKPTAKWLIGRYKNDLLTFASSLGTLLVKYKIFPDSLRLEGAIISNVVGKFMMMNSNISVEAATALENSALREFGYVS